MAKAKKNSIIGFPDDFIVVDIETTGLSPNYDSIIEISALKIENNSLVGQFSSLVKPLGGIFPIFPSDDKEYLYDEDGMPFYYVCDFISNLTGITNKMLDEAPVLECILSDFIPFVGDSIVVGHNVNFDINFLKVNISELLNKDFENEYIDTMRIARKLFKDEKHHRLKDIINYLGVPADKTKMHRGLYDCEITLNCFNRMKNLILDEYESLDSFIDLFKRSSTRFDPRSLIPDIDSIDDTNPFYNKECVFTGKLERLVRKDAQQIVINLGGSCGNSITKKTNYLILGNYDYCKNIKDGKSSKHKKAEVLKEKGMDIEVMPEDVFYDLAGFEIQ